MKKATLTVTEAAKILGVGRSAAYEAARAGQLPTIRIGRRILVPTNALTNLLQGSAEQLGLCDDPYDGETDAGPSRTGASKSSMPMSPHANSTNQPLDKGDEGRDQRNERVFKDANTRSSPTDGGPTDD